MLENSFSQRINAIIGKIREMRRSPYWPHLYIVKEDGEPALRMWALSCLVEDRTDGLPSYREYLETLRNKVYYRLLGYELCCADTTLAITGQLWLFQLIYY